MKLILIAINLIFISNCLGFSRKFFPKTKPIVNNGVQLDEPLFLTPFIEKGQYDLGQRLSKVKNLPKAPDVESYSGFLTVNKQYNSNMFFWFFPSSNPKAPVLLWLQGGPGGSSLFGLFIEHGPFVVAKDLTLSLRKYSWTNEYSMLYIDNPVGTGFSFTDTDDGYARNETHVANDLYSALQQFFTLFHQYRANDFYITGESYAGKYVPAIGYKIHIEKNSIINLKGIAIGDGLCDPETMFDYGDFLYQTGLLDMPQRNYFIEQQNQAVKYIKDKQFMKAFLIFDKLLNGDIAKNSSFTEFTGLHYYYNFLYTNEPKEFEYYNNYLTLPETRNAIHVGNLTYNDGALVEKHLLEDMMQSVKPWVAVLMDNYKVLIYSGQLDIIVAAPLTENFLRTVDWSKKDEYSKLKRRIWKVNENDDEIAGYVRKLDNFYQVIVRDAGHILPYDQPRSAYDMITKFVNDSL